MSTAFPGRLALSAESGHRLSLLTAFVAETANPIKVEGISRYGVHIVSAGRDFDTAKQAARLHAQVSGLRFVEDGAETEISEGESTGLMCEPSAVAGIAAIAAHQDRFAGRRLATILTGRNLTRAQIEAWFH